MKSVSSEEQQRIVRIADAAMRQAGIGIFNDVAWLLSTFQANSPPSPRSQEKEKIAL